MTITSIPNNDRVERLVASAGQSAFNYDFPIYAAGDLEVRRFRGDVQALLVLGADYTVAGVGQQPGGTLTLTAPALAGDLLVVRSAMPVQRTTKFENGGDLPAQSLNAELNRIQIALQQLRSAIAQALRLPPADAVTAAELPVSPSRLNTVLGFGANGEVVLVPRASIGGTSFQQIGAGAVQRTVQDELALLHIHPMQFGGTGDGSADDTLAVQRAANEAGARAAFLDLMDGTYRITDTITVPHTVAGMHMRGRLVYAGPAGRPALVIGNSAVRAQAKNFTGLRVVRETLASWTDEADVGIRLLNLDACIIEIMRVERFTIGVQTVGSGVSGSAAGFEDSNMHFGRIIDCRYGLDVRCTQPGPSAWNNSVRYFGGHFANSSATHPTLSRFGVRLSAAAGAYDLHNQHSFFGQGFELQRQGTPGTVDAIPFLVEVSGRALVAHDVRIEGCSPFVARHTAAFNDAIYRVGYVGTYGFLGCGIDYTSTASRTGGTVQPIHQAAAARDATRLVCGLDSVRNAAFRDTRVSSAGIGFDGMAVLSSNPSGPPTTLNGFCFGGLSSIDLNADSVQLPTSRALAWVVDCRVCKEFYLAVDGDNMRPVFLQFDAAENILTSATPLWLSNANVNWDPLGNAYWWEMNANLDSETGGFALNSLQRVTFHASAAFGVIALRGGDSVTPANNLLRAFRIFAAEPRTPRAVWGNNRGWGKRELTVSTAWDVPSLAAGATATLDVTLPGVRQGDLVTAGHAKDSGFQNGGVVFHAVVGGTAGTDQARVTAQNVSGGTIVVGAGTLFVRAVKPRI
jgi:hypothetical protein